MVPTSCEQQVCIQVICHTKLVLRCCELTITSNEVDQTSNEDHHQLAAGRRSKEEVYFSGRSEIPPQGKT